MRFARLSPQLFMLHICPFVFDCSCGGMRWHFFYHVNAGAKRKGPSVAPSRSRLRLYVFTFETS